MIKTPTKTKIFGYSSLQECLKSLDFLTYQRKTNEKEYIMRNKKMNIASIFISLLDDETLQEIFMVLCDHQTKNDAVRSFLTIEPALQKSKYIKRYINKKVDSA